MIQELFGLEGKCAMVVGGAGGLGQAQCKALAGAGADVAVCDISAQEGEKTVQEIRQQGRKAVFAPIDLRDKKSVVQAVEKVTDSLGKIDILCNTAGINNRAPILEYKEEDWDRVMDINLKGIFLVCQAVAPQMIERGYGKIINMSSIMGRITYFNQAAYSASKGGVNSLTQVMAVEWAQSGIRVNAIAPTYIKTPLVEKVLQDEPERVEFIKMRTPMGRLGLAEELMGLTVFLASPASDLVTGQSICVDGGWTAF